MDDKKKPAITPNGPINFLSADGQYAFFNVIEQEDENGIPSRTYYPVGSEEQPEREPDKIIAVGTKQDTDETVRIDVTPDGLESLLSISQEELNARVEDYKRSAAEKDNADDQITVSRIISDFHKGGYHVSNLFWSVDLSCHLP